MTAEVGATKERLAALGITQSEIARSLGVDPSAVTHKLAGRRPWTVEEANRVVAFLRERLQDDTLTLDQLFGTEGGVQLRLPMRYAKGAQSIPEAAPAAEVAKAS